MPLPKRSIKGFFFIFLLSVTFCLTLSGQSFAQQLKVGVYNNKPLVFQDEQGNMQGLTIDILRAMAAEEEWDLEFVPGSWVECLQRLEKGEIDLQVAIAYSSARSEIFSFPQKTLITNWGRLYRNPDTVADSLLDLDGMTVALLEKDIHAQVFTELMNKFSKNVKTVYLQSYDEVLKQVEAGNVNLGVVNRMYAMQNAHNFNVKATPMIFNPIQVRFAAPKGKNSAILQAIDHHLQLLREDKNSVYYRSLKKWFGQDHTATLPQWLKPALLAGGGLLFFIVLISLLLKKQISIKTKDLQTIFDSSPAAIFIHDKNGKIIDLNQTMLEMFKIKKEEALTLSIADYCSPENPMDTMSAMWEEASAGNPQRLEWIARRPNDDSTFLVQVNIKRIFYGNKEVIYANVQDITAEKEAKKQLASEQERLAVTLRSIGDGVIATDTSSNIVFLNKVAEELTGWKSEEAKGKPSSEVFNIINEKTGLECTSPIQRVLELGRIVGLANHTALIAKDGTLRSIADSGAPIRNPESKIVGVVLVFRDVSHEKRIEEELLKIRKLESIGVLAGGIAHDFNNILAAILGNIELTAFRIPEEDIKSIRLLKNAKKATRRATKLTQQLLTFAKGGDPVREEINLPELITESADFVLHGGSQVACTYNFPDDLWRVEVDSGQISQVIQNIILNAKHAMPGGGTVTICCDNLSDAVPESLLSIDAGDFVRITLQDTGIGIPKEIIDKIFDPYFSTKQEGSGLGLAICHSIINKHDGYLTVDSIPGKGTTFTIYLPAIPDTGVTTTKNSGIGITPSVTAARIMVMDDEVMLLDVALSQLTVLGHEAILVTNGVQAINRYQELQDQGSPVDLVIMDLTIPGGMGGQEAARQLLKIDPKAKIIVASGYSNDPVMADYEGYGFCAAIAKPFDLKELNSTITSVL